jgi:hypothetical protein
VAPASSREQDVVARVGRAQPRQRTGARAHRRADARSHNLSSLEATSREGPLARPMPGIHDDRATCAKLRAFKSPRIDALRARLPGLRASELLYLWLDPQGQRELAKDVLDPKDRPGFGGGPNGTPQISQAELETLGAAVLALQDEIDRRQAASRRDDADSREVASREPAPVISRHPKWDGKP